MITRRACFVADFIGFAADELPSCALRPACSRATQRSASTGTPHRGARNP